MDLTKHKPVEELIEKFKEFKVNPLDVMIAIPKVKSTIILDGKASNDRSKEMVKNGVAVINKGNKVEDWDRYIQLLRNHTMDKFGFELRRLSSKQRKISFSSRSQ